MKWFFRIANIRNITAGILLALALGSSAAMAEEVESCGTYKCTVWSYGTEYPSNSCSVFHTNGVETYACSAGDAQRNLTNRPNPCDHRCGCDTWATGCYLVPRVSEFGEDE